MYCWWNSGCIKILLCLPINDSMKTDQLEYYIALDCDWLAGGHMANQSRRGLLLGLWWKENEVSVFPSWLFIDYRQTSFYYSSKGCFGIVVFFSSQIESPTLHQQKNDDSLYCNPCFVVWPGSKPTTPLRWACIDLLTLDSSGRTWERLSENKANIEES